MFELKLELPPTIYYTVAIYQRTKVPNPACRDKMVAKMVPNLKFAESLVTDPDFYNDEWELVRCVTIDASSPSLFIIVVALNIQLGNEITHLQTIDERFSEDVIPLFVVLDAAKLSGS